MDTNVGEKIAMGRGGNGMMKFGGTGVGRGSPGRRKKKMVEDVHRRQPAQPPGAAAGTAGQKTQAYGRIFAP